MVLLRIHNIGICAKYYSDTPLQIVLPRGYKTFSMLSSAEHERILLINVKMPTIVGILTFISMINRTFERL